VLTAGDDDRLGAAAQQLLDQHFLLIDVIISIAEERLQSMRLKAVGEAADGGFERCGRLKQTFDGSHNIQLEPIWATELRNRKRGHTVYLMHSMIINKENGLCGFM